MGTSPSTRPTMQRWSPGFRISIVHAVLRLMGTGAALAGDDPCGGDPCGCISGGCQVPRNVARSVSLPRADRFVMVRRRDFARRSKSSAVIFDRARPFGIATSAFVSASFRNLAFVAGDVAPARAAASLSRPPLLPPSTALSSSGEATPKFLALEKHLASEHAPSLIPSWSSLSPIAVTALTSAFRMKLSRNNYPRRSATRRLRPSRVAASRRPSTKTSARTLGASTDAIVVRKRWLASVRVAMVGWRLC